MKTIKIIDLLNKIANEEVRHDIKINTRNYYCSIEEYLKKFGINEDTLNVEVIGFDDIIEEDKKIEKIIPTSLKGIDNLDEIIEVAHIDTISAIDKINEIIDYINKNEENK